MSAISTTCSFIVSSKCPGCVVLLQMPNNMYFAIGSMMNQTSLAGRGLMPLNSWPAELLEHSLGFLASSAASDAMATAVPEAGATFHGVILEMSDEHMVELDKVESGYDRCAAVARKYDGSEVTVTVYRSNAAWTSGEMAQGNGKADGTELPSQRYIDILCMGAESYGVKAEYVEWLRAQPCTPRKKMQELWRIPRVGLENVAMSLAELEGLDGSDGKPLVMCHNGVVLLWTGSMDGPMVPLIKGAHAAGPAEIDMTSRVARLLFEPMFGPTPPQCTADMSEEHKAWTEDILGRFLGSQIQPIALIRGGENASFGRGAADGNVHPTVRPKVFAWKGGSGNLP